MMNEYAPKRQPQPPAKFDMEDDGLGSEDEAFELEDNVLSAQSKSVSDPLPVAPAPLPKPKPTPEELEQRRKAEKEADLVRRAAEITAYFGEHERKRLAGEPAYESYRDAFE
jgi:hypothetical protein